MNAQPQCRSWAAIVKGDAALAEEELLPSATPATVQEDTDLPEEQASSIPLMPPGVFTTSISLRPGVRGSLRCLCRGKVLSMLSYYGWLEAIEHIDHPLVGKHFGRIYLQNSDVVEGHTVCPGDEVSFYLYADDLGLGAEACRLVERGELCSSVQEERSDEMCGMRADAVEFVPSGLAVLPPAHANLAMHSTQGVADVFTRMSRTFHSIPANGCVQMVGFNSAYFNDDDSSDDGEANDASAEADKESVHDESDNSSAEDAPPAQKLGNATLFRLAPWKARRGSSPDRSTDAGDSIDSPRPFLTSESEADFKPSLPAGPPSRKLHTFRPPPGLELPEDVLALVA